MFPAGDLRYRVSYPVLASGERVRVIETGPVTGDTVLCIGGWWCSVWDFHRILPALAASGYRAMAMDLRGHGLSDKPGDEALYSTRALTDQVCETLDVLGLQRPAVLGHSMGGAIAVHVAMRALRLRALALVSPVGFGDVPVARLACAVSPPWMIPALRVLARRQAVAAGLRLLYVNDDCVDERTVDEYWAPSQFASFVPAQRATLHRFRWTPFTRSELDRVGVPTLLVRGAHDPVVRAPRSPLDLPAGFIDVVLEGAGHLPHDEAPERARTAIIQFLDATR